MSALTETHNLVTRLLMWHGRQLAPFRALSFDDDVEVVKTVQYYHKTDRYRQAYVYAPNQKFLEELAKEIEKPLSEKARSVYIHMEIRKAEQRAMWVLDISIWSRDTGYLKIDMKLN